MLVRKQLFYYYAKASLYNSSDKRFFAEDTINDGLNWYVYTENNPLKYIDLDGLAHIEYTSIEKSVR